MNFDMDIPTVVLKDEAGRSLLCYVEYSMELDDRPYVLLIPVHTAVNFFIWEEEDEEEPLLIETEAEVAKLFATAQAVLEEQNLKLHWSAVTLTVEGDIPDFDETEEDLDWNEEDLNGSDHEAFEFLASFYHQGQEYGVYYPVDPPMILARMERGTPQLLSEAEMEQLTPLLEARLAEELDQ
jgi:hypothetical protein